MYLVPNPRLSGAPSTSGPPLSAHEWVSGIGFTARGLWNALAASDESSAVYKQTCNLRAVQILLGHTKIESTVRYLGVNIEDALALAEGTEV
jgi:hypothetical protein